MKIAGLDIGTTGCKCMVFDENGKCLGKAYRDYPVRRKVTGHEIDDFARWTSRFLVLDRGIISASIEAVGVDPATLRERLDAALGEGRR